MFDCIALVTDFGAGSPYIGQMLRLLATSVPANVRIFNLIADLEPFRPDLAAYLLPQLMLDMPIATLYICVVDPGVGGEREVLAMQADGNWYLAPDNGLLAIIAKRADNYELWRISWRPTRLSASFHGRDLLVPLAVTLMQGQLHNLIPSRWQLSDMVGHDWPDDIMKVIYQDGYGNLCCGARADLLPDTTRLMVGDHSLVFARTFSTVAPGTGFWYKNAFGLVEIAINQGRASQELGIKVGDPIALTTT